MYKELEKICNECGSKMMEILDYIEEPPEGEHPKAFRKGWICIYCDNWESAILRERVAQEKED